MADSYLTRTPNSAVTLGTKATISFWVKRSGLDSGTSFYGILSSNGGWNDGTGFAIGWREDMLIWYNLKDGSGYRTYPANLRKFRDTSAWYHIVYQIDTTQASLQDRVTLYVNGEDQGDMTTNAAGGISAAMPAQNATLYQFFDNGDQHQIGRGGSAGSTYFDGYLSHFAYVDGSVVALTSFGQTDSTSGEWKFKTPSGITWGNNGFHLKFENSGNLGLDSSGGGNNFTTNGSLKQSISTPTNTYTTLNNLSNAMAGDYTIGNTTVQSQNASDTSAPAYANYGVSKGKWYWEVKCAAVSQGTWTYANIGITALLRHSNAQTYNQLGAKAEDFSYYAYNGNIMNNDTGNTGDAYGNSYTLNDIIGVALDLDNNKLYFHKNGTYQNSGVPTSGSTGTGAVSITDPDDLGDGVYYPAVGDYHYVPRYTFQMNFGEGRFGTTAVSSAGSNSGDGIFEYDVPSGYYALNTKNINTYG